VLSLACTPVNTLFGFRQVIGVRRALGLYAFMYAAIHVTIFTVLDYGLDWGLLLEAVLEKRFIFVGLAALLILLSLATTSFKWWQKRLGKNWKRLHRLIYVASGLVIVHYTWATKGDLLRLQGDIWQPLSFGAVVAILLVLRIPAIRRAITSFRARLKRRQPALRRGQEARTEPGRGKPNISIRPKNGEQGLDL
jgi:sulfoxide reductase heme-binding subunit YedZ